MLAAAKAASPTMRWMFSVAMPLTRWNALNVAANRNTASSSVAPGGLDFSRFSMLACFRSLGEKCEPSRAVSLVAISGTGGQQTWGGLLPESGAGCVVGFPGLHRCGVHGRFAVRAGKLRLAVNVRLTVRHRCGERQVDHRQRPLHLPGVPDLRSVALGEQHRRAAVPHGAWDWRDDDVFGPIDEIRNVMVESGNRNKSSVGYGGSQRIVRQSS